MKEPRWITAMRHLLLLSFVAISLYPALNVFTISLRPDDRLRSTDLSIIPENWTFDSYVQLFTDQPFLRWLGNSMIVATARSG
jgi:arabinogalactan oligomer/maltooligosaccharide transport system permease protein